MGSKFCTLCNFEKHINSLQKKYSEGEDCKIERGVKRYYNNKDKITIQQKIILWKKDKQLQKQNDYRDKRSTDYKELLKSHVELQNKLKTLEEKSHTQQI